MTKATISQETQVLDVLFYQTATSPKQVAAALMIPGPSARRALQRLVKAGRAQRNTRGWYTKTDSTGPASN